MAAPKAVCIELSEFETAELQSRLRRRKVARADAIRAEVVLLAAQGVSNLNSLPHARQRNRTVSLRRAPVPLCHGCRAAAQAPYRHPPPIRKGNSLPPPAARQIN